MTDPKSILDDLVYKPLPTGVPYRYTIDTPLPPIYPVAEHSTLLQTPYHLGNIIDAKTANHHDVMEMLDDGERAAIQKRLDRMQAAHYEKAFGTQITAANPPVEPLSIDAMLEWFRMMDEMLHRSKADQVKKLMQAGVMVCVNRSMPEGSMVMTVGGDYERAVEIALEEFAKEKARG